MAPAQTPRFARLRDAAKRAQRALGIRPRGLAVVIGSPRSGTTALCNWLNEQPGIAATQESRTTIATHRFMNEVRRFRFLSQDSEILTRLLRSLAYDYYASNRLLTTRILVDKETLEPTGFPDRSYERYVENLDALFPEARLLFMVRDPLDTIGSMRARQFGHSLTDAALQSFDLETCIDTWRRAAHIALERGTGPRAQRVRFEDLVSQPEAQSREIFAHLGASGGRAFSPKPTRPSEWHNDEADRVREATRPEAEALGYA